MMVTMSIIDNGTKGKTLKIRMMEAKIYIEEKERG